MKTFYKYLIVVAVAGLLFLIAYKLFNKDDEVSTNNVAEIIKLQNEPTKHYTDKEGIQHATHAVVTDPNRNLVIAMYQDSLKTLANKLGIAESQITQFGQINTELKMRLKPEVIYVDSSKKQLQLKYKDPYLDLFGIVSAENKDSYIDYTGRDTLRYVFHNNKQNFIQKLFKTPGQTFDVYTRNKKVSIPNVSAVIIPPAADSHLKFGFYTGYGAQLNTTTNGVTFGPQIGAGLTYKF